MRPPHFLLPALLICMSVIPAHASAAESTLDRAGLRQWIAEFSDRKPESNDSVDLLKKVKWVDWEAKLPAPLYNGAPEVMLSKVMVETGYTDTCDRVRNGYRQGKRILEKIGELSREISKVNLDGSNEMSSLARANEISQKIGSLYNEFENAFPPEFDDPHVGVSYIFTNLDRFAPLPDRGSYSRMPDHPMEVVIRDATMNGYHWVNDGRRHDPINDPGRLSDGRGDDQTDDPYSNQFIYYRSLSPVEVCLGDNSARFSADLLFPMAHEDESIRPVWYNKAVHVVLVAPQLDYNRELHDNRSALMRSRHECRINFPFQLFCDHG